MYYTRIFLFVKFWGITARTQTVPPYGRNVLNVTQSPRELRGSQIPGSKHAIPEPHRCGSSGRKEKDTTRCAQTSVTDFLTQSPVS